MVLLDEADVFLEERTLFDLQRNALVSGEYPMIEPVECTNYPLVFLRVLEYYEGTGSAYP